MNEITELTANENILKGQVDQLTSDNNDLTAQLNEERSLRKKLQDEIAKIQKTQEEEVQLRL